jgi:hypothetical protein
MGRYYSPEGNYEVWDEKPVGYFTEEEWAALHPPTPYIPTKEEKLAQLDAQYDTDVAELTRYFTEAALEDDAELQEEIKAELAEVKATYVEERKAIEEGDD